MASFTEIPHVINLGNSIIGVSILAMPFCFKQCGIALAILLVLFSNCLTKATCHLLLRSAQITKKRNYEFLSYHVLGPVGKFAVEISMIGFLIGTGIAYFVIIGDLGPPIVANLLGIEDDASLRKLLMVAMAVLILPLCLLREIASLSHFNAMSMLFYCIFVGKIVFESLPMLLSSKWLLHANLWRPAGVFRCLPIFAMALSCQFQIFVIYEDLADPSLKAMKSIVAGAVNLCSLVYITVSGRR
ncbi:PREDICTED: putative sodium-coupled neutral amino acid transporter 10 [Priapulus caudatus]|uniref:Sodium-coupled neutral amino acid transporter 10 n=1 Tax=Priapulus caudatus TaxID=37621 RepID=A0ABM1E8V9_PRICU|nr:PREDICTED: putative sodium-coupled neutral amino acid transporter 10 [Priapulus caudatus]